MQKPTAAGEAVERAPPALDLATLPEDEPRTKQPRLVRATVENGWPVLPDALSLITSILDNLGEVLSSYQAMMNVSGMLALSTPRDAFLTSLAKFTITSWVVHIKSGLVRRACHASPSIPEPYIYLLGVQCLASISSDAQVETLVLTHTAANPQQGWHIT